MENGSSLPIIIPVANVLEFKEFTLLLPRKKKKEMLSKAKIKYIQQEVIVPSETKSLIFSAFGKADSVATTGVSTYRLMAQIRYTDGTSEEAKYQDFDATETGWQFAAVGLVRSAENVGKQISKVLVRAEYSHNSGTAYFDNFRLSEGKFVRQEIITEGLVSRGEEEFPMCQRGIAVDFGQMPGQYAFEVRGDRYAHRHQSPRRADRFDSFGERQATD